MRLILAFIILMSLGCKKDKDPVVADKSVTELLTQKTWILAAAGFDDNKNDVLDDNENTIQDCQKDNSFLFNPNGTGQSSDNQLLCSGVEDSQFSWSLINSDTELLLEGERIFVKRLNENEMILSPNLPGLTVSFFMIYKH
jgi:hypothetical protein